MYKNFILEFIRAKGQEGNGSAERLHAKVGDRMLLPPCLFPVIYHWVSPPCAMDIRLCRWFGWLAGFLIWFFALMVVVMDPFFITSNNPMQKWLLFMAFQQHFGHAKPPFNGSRLEFMWNPISLILNVLLAFEIPATAYIIGESLVAYQIGCVADRSGIIQSWRKKKKCSLCRDESIDL